MEERVPSCNEIAYNAEELRIILALASGEKRDVLASFPPCAVLQVACRQHGQLADGAQTSHGATRAMPEHGKWQDRGAGTKCRQQPPPLLRWWPLARLQRCWAGPAGRSSRGTLPWRSGTERGTDKAGLGMTCQRAKRGRRGRTTAASGRPIRFRRRGYHCHQGRRRRTHLDTHLGKGQGQPVSGQAKTALRRRKPAICKELGGFGGDRQKGTSGRSAERWTVWRAT